MQLCHVLRFVAATVRSLTPVSTPLLMRVRASSSLSNPGEQLSSLLAYSLLAPQHQPPTRIYLETNLLIRESCSTGEPDH